MLDKDDSANERGGKSERNNFITARVGLSFLTKEIVFCRDLLDSFKNFFVI